MTLVPIAAREARAISRRARSYHLRWIFGLFGILAILYSLWLARYQQNKGEFVFLALAAVAQFYCLFAGVIASADTISSERREQTLGLLFLTDLKPKDVMLGKFISSASTSFFGLLAILPLLTVPFLMGGVSAERYQMLLSTLSATLFFSVSVAFLASSIFREGWATMTAGLIVMLALGMLLPIPCLFWKEWEPFAFLSPSIGLVALIESPPDVKDLLNFYFSYFFSLFGGFFFLLIASFRLVTISRDRPRNIAQQKRFEFLQKLRFGSKPARRNLRTKLLDQNPLAWFANREQVSSFGLLLSTFAFAFTFFLLLLLTADLHFEKIALFGFIGLGLAHVALFFRICIAAAYQMAEERKSGALELLLSTPLTVSEIIRGRWLALIRQFFGPAIVLTVLHAFLLIGFTTQIDQGTVRLFFHSAIEFSLGEQQLFFGILWLAWIVFAVDWVAAGWLGLWLGLRFKSSAAAVWTTFSIVLMAPWTFFAGLILVAQTFGVFDDTETQANGESFLLWAGALLALASAGALIFIGRRKLTKNFRTAAADRFTKFAFPWGTLFRCSAFLFVVVFAIGTTLYIWRDRINERGAMAWKQAQAEHPAFSRIQPEPPRIKRLPPQINFIESQALQKFMPNMQARRSSRQRPSVSRVTTFSSPTATRIIYSLLQSTNDVWTSGKLLPLNLSLEKLQSRRALTNIASSLKEVFAEDEADLAKVFLDAARLPGLQLRNDAEDIYPFAWGLALHASIELRAGSAPTNELFLLMRLNEGLGTNDTYHLSPLRASVAIAHEGLAQHRWNAEQLLQIQSGFGRLDVWSGLQNQAESAIRDTLQTIEFSTGSDSMVRWRQKWAQIRPFGWTQQSMADAFRLAFETIPNFTNADAHRIELGRIIAFKSLPRNDIADDYLFHFGDRYINVLQTRARMQTMLTQVQAACALERFRLERRRYPQTLAELDPQDQPIDVMSGEAMIYMPSDSAHGYRLYSVGWDGRDQDGNADDWVWLQK